MATVKVKRGRGGRNHADAAPPSSLLLVERTVLASLLLLVFLVFSRSAQVQFTLPKLLALRVTTACVLLVWAARVRRGEALVLPRSIWISLLALVAWSVAATWFAVHWPTALEGMHGRYNGLFTELMLWSVFLVVATSATNRDEVEWLMTALVVTLVPVAIYAVARALGFDAAAWPEPRPASTIGNPVSLAALLGLAVPFVVAFLACETARWKQVLWAAVLVLFLWAIVATMSRGPWIGVAVSGVVIALGLAFERRASARRLQLPLIAALVASVIVVAAAIPSARAALGRFASRVASATRFMSDEALINRAIYIQAAARMIADRPIAGVGQESFGLLYPQYRPVEPEAIPADQIPTMVHDVYLQIAVSSGVAALVAYGALVGSILILLLRSWREVDAQESPVRRSHQRIVSAAFAASIAGCLVQQLSGWPDISLDLALWIVLGSAVAYARAPVPATARRLSRRWRTIAVPAGVAAAIAVSVLAVASARELQADVRMAEAERLAVTDDWPRILDDIHGALALVAHDAHYEDEAGVLSMKRLFAVGDRANYDRAVAWIDDAARDNAFDPYVLIHRIDVDTIAVQRHIVTRGSPEAADAIDRLLQMDPNNATVHESIARLRMAEGRPQEALVAIRRAEALRPAHARYHALEGDALRALGDRRAAVAAYRAEVVTLPLVGQTEWVLAERKLIAALLESGQVDAAASECDAAIQIAPSDSLLHTLRGFAWLGQAAPTHARTSFARALELDPSNLQAREGLDAIAR